MAAASDLRRGVAALSGSASRDLARLWDQVSDAAAAREALNDVLPGLVDTYGVAAAALAADWYDDLRDKVGPRRAFAAIPADVADTGTPALVGWALDKATDFAAFQTLIEGGTQRRIANFSRLTVTGSSIADPAARGWMRVGTGECDFCQMLLGRGAVYSEATADFQSHDHCNCGAEPAF